VIERFSALRLRGSDLSGLSVDDLQEPEWSFLAYAAKKRLIKFVDSLRSTKASLLHAVNWRIEGHGSEVFISHFHYLKHNRVTSVVISGPSQPLSESSKSINPKQVARVLPFHEHFLTPIAWITYHLLWQVEVIPKDPPVRTSKRKASEPDQGSQDDESLVGVFYSCVSSPLSILFNHK